MTSRHRHPRLGVNAIAAAKPGRRSTPSGTGRSGISGCGCIPPASGPSSSRPASGAACARSRSGASPRMGIEKARREAATVLARLWGGEAVAAPRKAPLFRDFAARYRERRRHRWKPSSLETFDIYLRNACCRISGGSGSTPSTMPASRRGSTRRARPRRLRQHRQKPAQARRPIPRPRGTETPRRGARPAPGATPVAGRGDPPADAHRGAALRSHRPQVERDRRACRGRRQRAPRRLQDRAAHRLARAGSGKAARGAAPARGQGTGVPRGPRGTGSAPSGSGRKRQGCSRRCPGPGAGNGCSPRTSRNRLYTFWVGIREEAGLPGLRIHDCRHTRASQGVMNGVGLTTVGRLLGHRQRETTAIYATSTMARCATPPPRRRPSSHAPWDTGPSRRPCRKKRTWRETAWNPIG